MEALEVVDPLEGLDQEAPPGGEPWQNYDPKDPYKNFFVSPNEDSYISTRGVGASRRTLPGSVQRGASDSTEGISKNLQENELFFMADHEAHVMATSHGNDLLELLSSDFVKIEVEKLPPEPHPESER